MLEGGKTKQKSLLLVVLVLELSRRRMVKIKAKNLK